MEATRRRAVRKIVLVTDALVIVLSMVTAYAAHTGLRQFLPFLKEPPLFQHYAALAYLTLPLWLSLVVVFRLHRCFERLWSWSGIFFGLVRLHAVGLIGLSLLLFLTQSIINRTLVALFMISTLALMWSARFLIGQRLRDVAERGSGRQRTLLVGGAPKEMTLFVRDARADPLPPTFVGFLAPPDEEGAGASFPSDFPPRLGSLDELDSVLHEQAVDQVLFFSPLDRPDSVPAALEILRSLGVPAGFAIRHLEPFQARPRVQSFYDQTFVTFEVSPKSAEAMAVKHGLDFILAALALLILSPILLLSALAVLVTMGRPVLFIQERAGLYGRRFRMLKFRTMERGAEERRDELLDLNEMSGPVFKITEDPRITPLGRLLRRSSIDELPQLINVLLGSMSLVGPRPLPYHEQQLIRGWHRRRLSMRPGITGLWQVSGRSEVDFDEWIQLDLRYIDEWSLRLDLTLLLRTIPAVLLKRGAR